MLVDKAKINKSQREQFSTLKPYLDIFETSLSFKACSLENLTIQIFFFSGATIVIVIVMTVLYDFGMLMLLCLIVTIFIIIVIVTNICVIVYQQ